MTGLCSKTSRHSVSLARDHHHEVLRIVDPEIEHWWSKEVSQTCNCHDGKQRRCGEAAHQGEQHDHDQIGECGRGKVDVKPKESQGRQCQRNAAEEKLRGEIPEIRGLAKLHRRPSGSLR